MSNTKLQTARELIKEKHYAEARALLKTMPDDPTAQRWLAKLDEITPSTTTTETNIVPERKSSVSKLVWIVILLGLVIGGIWLLKHQQDYSHWQSQVPEAKAALSVFCTINDFSSSIGCDQWATRTINEDISRTDNVLFCTNLYGPSFTGVNANLISSCLADKGIYLP